MKTKFIVFLGISAIATLSFTFVSVANQNKPKAEPASAQKIDNEPIGGFLAEDKL